MPTIQSILRNPTSLILRVKQYNLARQSLETIPIVSGYAIQIYEYAPSEYGD